VQVVDRIHARLALGDRAHTRGIDDAADRLAAPAVALHALTAHPRLHQLVAVPVGEAPPRPDRAADRRAEGVPGVPGEHPLLAEVIVPIVGVLLEEAEPGVAVALPLLME